MLIRVERVILVLPFFVKNNLGRLRSPSVEVAIALGQAQFGSPASPVVVIGSGLGQQRLRIHSGSIASFGTEPAFPQLLLM
jgi:hypothetical protein